MTTRAWPGQIPRRAYGFDGGFLCLIGFIAAMLALAGCAQTARETGLPASVVATTPNMAAGGGTVPAGAPARINAPMASPDAPRRMRGLYALTGNAGSFTDCLSGQRLPVSPEADSMTLERAYGISRSFGESLLTSVEASMAMRPALANLKPDSPPPTPMLVVQRFISLSSDTACPPRPAAVALQGTYWKLDRLRGNAIERTRGQAEPHLVLQSAKSRVSGSSGCNRLAGTYLLKGNRLKLTRLAVIGKPCRNGGKQAQMFVTALRQVVSWRVSDGQLLLEDAQGSPITEFTAQAKR